MRWKEFSEAEATGGVRSMVARRSVRVLGDFGIRHNLPRDTIITAMHNEHGDVMLLLSPVPPVEGIRLRDVEVWIGGGQGAVMTITLRAADTKAGQGFDVGPGARQTARYLETLLGGGWTASKLAHGEINPEGDSEWLMRADNAPGWLGELVSLLEDSRRGPALRAALPDHDPAILREVSALDRTSLARGRVRRALEEPGLRRILAGGARLGRTAAHGSSQIMTIGWDLPVTDINGLEVDGITLVCSVHAREDGSATITWTLDTSTTLLDENGLRRWGESKRTTEALTKLLNDLLGQEVGVGELGMRWFMASVAGAAFILKRHAMNDGVLRPLVGVLEDPALRPVLMGMLPAD